MVTGEQNMKLLNNLGLNHNFEKIKQQYASSAQNRENFDNEKK